MEIFVFFCQISVLARGQIVSLVWTDNVDNMDMCKWITKMLIQANSHQELKIATRKTKVRSYVYYSLDRKQRFPSLESPLLYTGYALRRTKYARRDAGHDRWAKKSAGVTAAAALRKGTDVEGSVLVYSSDIILGYCAPSAPKPNCRFVCSAGYYRGKLLVVVCRFRRHRSPPLPVPP